MLSDLKLTQKIACPRVWRGCISGEDIVATVDGDDITIGGERSAVELLIKMNSKKKEIKKQVIGKRADLEKSGRILNRVIFWGRDGITIEADQRHVREILKGLELDRANHSATPCAMERKDEGKGRRLSHSMIDHARRGTRQEDRTIPRREAESEVLIPLAAE